MPDKNLFLPWGREKLPVNLPESWNLLGSMEPAALKGLEDVPGVIEASLANPIGMDRLSRLAGAGQRIALVIDDDSRPTPVATLLPAVLAELTAAGAGAEQITVIPALGVHRPMTVDEVNRRTGMSGLKIETHDCDDPAKLVYLGASRCGTPVYVNKTAAGADLIISIGCIEPHIIASFGGGYKNLVPGLAGRVTIAHNHAINCRPDTFNNVGQPIERNPMRLDLEECAQMLKPPVFIVNTVLNSSMEIVKVVAGHPLAAHRAGALASSQIYGARIPALADVVISNSFPMDQDLRQGVKALANTVRAVKPGGVMICLVRAEEGLGVFGLANRRLPLGRAGLKLLAPLLLPLVPRLKLNGMGEEDRFFLYFALQVLRRCEVYMVAPNIPAGLHENLPFISFKGSLKEALDQTRKRFPGRAGVLVFPNGGSTYPILPG